MNIGGNASSPASGRRGGAPRLTDAREKLAAFLGCHPGDIIWTSGATEANNMVTHHFAQDARREDEIWVSAIEHPCVHESAKHYFGKRAKLIPVTHDGVVDLDWLTTEMADKRPGLVGVMAANNETGVIQPWREIHAICQAYEVPFFTDAVQFIGKMPLKGLGECDYVSGAAHKFGGPRGVGFLKIPHRKSITPLLARRQTGRGRRAGTENVAIIAAMLAALEMREKQISHSQHLLRGVWRENFERELLRTLPGATIVGANVPRLWNTVSAIMPEGDRKYQWVIAARQGGLRGKHRLGLHDRQGRAGHVLAAMGFKAAQAQRVVRFSAGWETTRRRLGRAGQRGGQNPRRRPSRQDVSPPRRGQVKLPGTGPGEHAT